MVNLIYLSFDEPSFWHLMKTKRLFCLSLTFGFALSMLTMVMVKNVDLSLFFQDEIPQSALHICLHNIKIYLLFFVPLWGIVHFVYSFSLTFIFIGLAFAYMGVLNTITQLYHLPLELYAFCIPITYKKRPFHPRSFIIALAKGIFYLIIASMIEFYI